MSDAKSQVGAQTLTKLRSLYREQWSREWPEDDAYLAELWREAREVHHIGQSRRAHPEAYQHCLTSMRENHEFDASAPPTAVAAEGHA